MVFAFLLAFTNVPQQNVTTTGQVIENLELGGVAESIGTFLTDFISPEKVDATFIKYTFFILLTFFIISILSMAEMPKNSFLRVLFAIPISYLSIFLIKPEEILSALVLYSALGMTFIVIIPLVILVLFTSQILKGKLSHGKILIQLMTWYFYLAFLIYFLARAFTDTQNEYSPWVMGIIILGMIFGIIIIALNKNFRIWIRNLIREGRSETLKDIADIRRAEEKEKRESGEDALRDIEKTKKY